MIYYYKIFIEKDKFKKYHDDKKNEFRNQEIKNRSPSQKDRS